MRITALIKTLLINALRVLKDEDYQKRVWFRRKGPEVSTYIDTVVFFIDKSKKIIEYPHCEEELGKDNFEILKKLYKLVREHVDGVEERMDADLLEENELLNDPKWHDIQMLSEDLEARLINFLERSDDNK